MPRDPKDNPKKKLWFIFEPLNWLEILEMKNTLAGTRFKTMIRRLLQNSAPDGTEEARMIDKANKFSQRQRNRIVSYWNSRRPPEPPAEKDGDGSLAEPPELDEVYDVCSVAGIDPDTGREFHEWMTRKDLWKTLRAPWNVALRGFDRRKRERNAARKNQTQQPPTQEEGT